MKFRGQQQERIYKFFGVITALLLTLWLLLPSNVSTTKLSAKAGISLPLETYVSQNNLGFKYNRVKQAPYPGPRVKAAFVTLARNRDLWGLIKSIKSVEDRFNYKFQYNWIFLNDDEFTDEFKRLTTAVVSGETFYGKVPKEQWSVPDWIDKEKAAKGRTEMREKGVLYGDSVPYRFMCRYESGLFFKHPLLDDYEYYWRVEPDVEFFCDIDYDVFKFMKDNNKMYGFTISLHEYEETVKTLWNTTKSFLEEHPQYLHENNMMDFISDDEGFSYNMCHFWSNFEVASLDFWRGPAYTDYFNYLDKAGGFFYERWGDAPVHSIAAALFLDRNQIHHFDDISYYHPPFVQCSVDENVRLNGRCTCDPKEDFTWNDYSCTSKYYYINNLEKPKNWQMNM
ncbi:probable Alpha-1,2 mannosyltransferase KTR1 [Saccharomycodes ludwigii]|uniref:Probable Alpha-1,2 mannosyltransferase KTR1 n=1 Tax=Saccharomycodes ludwigii TaxID=36035 RepID=A0A376B8V9_9ASCO|nr:hypothetical protein SCDLUD_003203 [Saccharomycodes ludwigii]KAH3900232.1 hypothetical protein SCDLUD_003203 [Saccharomycodes ludwigii]SSD60560.1 probable Alpha-1,2 mannosyltransferase KTR1 [Saccharomycodes ludwigii]